MLKIISIILIYFGLRIMDKFITDNLPDLNYKNLVNLFASIMALVLIGWLFAMSKISKNPKYKEAFFKILVIYVVGYKLINVKKASPSSIH